MRSVGRVMLVALLRTGELCVSSSSADELKNDRAARQASAEMTSILYRNLAFRD